MRISDSGELPWGEVEIGNVIDGDSALIIILPIGKTAQFNQGERWY